MAAADDGAAGGGAGGGDPGAAGAGAAGAAGGGAGAGVATEGGAGGGAAGGTVLAGGAAASATAAAGATAGPFGAIPEKFHVKAADGTPDLAASWAKVEEHRSNLEKRLGTGDIPPKTAEEYKVNVPEAMKATFKPEDVAKDPMLQAFLKDAHAAGMTQKQVDFALASWFERAPQLSGALAQQKADECTAELKQEWKTDVEFKAHVDKAFAAGKAFAGADFEGILKDHGNDARIVRMLAKIGAELGPDGNSPNNGGSLPDADVDALTKSKAYWDKNDPQHLTVKAKVEAHYAAKFGNVPKGGPTVLAVR